MHKILLGGNARGKGDLPILSGIVVASLATALTACASSGSTNRDGSSSATGGGADVAGARAFVTKYSAPLTTFSLPALKAAPPRGKKVALVVNNIPESHQLMLGMEDGAKALGWTTVPIVYDPSSPTGLTDAFNQAVEDHPDAVITQAVNASAYSAAAKELTAKKIPVVTSNTTDRVTPPVISNVTNGDQFARTGQILANYIIAQKGDKANVALFNIPSFPVLTAFEKGFKSEYLRLCPSCKYKSINVQPGDIGTKVPAQVVSAVQTDPSIGYAVMGFGAVSTGVSAALRTAGVTNVKVVGPAPAEQNIAALTRGTEDMWVGYPLQGVGWKSIDALARYFTHESTAIDDTAPTPFQILTKATVGDGGLPEVANYQQQFKKLWHVG